jgi:uncharacterized protein YutE (UPF0331/DUF86 family)
MDREVVAQKLEALRRCLARVREKCPKSADILAKDADLQDIISINITRAVQLCVDIGTHVIAGMSVSPPDTMGKTFDQLAEAGIIPPDVAEQLKKAVGFRNIAVHNYESINWAIVHSIASDRLVDFEEFAKAIVDRLQ